MFTKVILFLALASPGLTGEEGFGFRADEWILRRSSSENRTLGGTEAKLGEFPYMVSIALTGPFGGDFCAGAIISKRTVLTSAHCLIGLDLPSWAHLGVVAGKIGLDDYGPHVQTSRVKEAIPHPDFIPHKVYNDIGTIILEKPFKFTEYIQPVALPEPGESFTGNATLAAWGRTGQSDMSYPDKLQKMVAPLADEKKCRDVYQSIASKIPEIICTLPNEANQQPCIGDAEGLLTKNVNGNIILIGISSQITVPCGTTQPAPYAKVSSHIGFIKNNSE